MTREKGQLAQNRMVNYNEWDIGIRERIRGK